VKPVLELDPGTLSTLTWELRCQEQNRPRKAPLFRRHCDVMSATHGTSWQPLRLSRHTPALVPPVADGPGVSPMSACGDGEPEAVHTLERTTTTNITHDTRRSPLSVARSSLPHPYMRWTPTVDPNHDADIRIGSEAPKQRCPFLITARKPWVLASNRYLGSFLADRRSQSAGVPKLMIFCFSC
jgi:hypothetical protein